MSRLNIPYLSDLNNSTIENAAALLMQNGTSASIETLNWPDQFNYKPETQFFIARSEDAVYLHYTVKGLSLKAVYSEDQSNVHEDSCVEFFCMPEGADSYTNFEFNAIGVCSASWRKGRSEGIVPFPEGDMQRIERYATAGTEPFEEKTGEHSWELTVKIPLDMMGVNPENLPEKIRGNFYKCADKTEAVHFVSWAPIATENPDFHRPEFFGELVLVH